MKLNNKILPFVLLFISSILVNRYFIHAVNYYKLIGISFIAALVFTLLFSVLWNYYRNWRKNYLTDKMMKNINNTNQ